MHKSIVVYGIVQGVGYRYYCLKTAKNIGIMGYVKNLTDGSVSIEAEGTDKQLSIFVNLIKQGATHANISDLKIINGKFCNYKQFSLKC